MDPVLKKTIISFSVVSVAIAVLAAVATWHTFTSTSTDVSKGTLTATEISTNSIQAETITASALSIHTISGQSPVEFQDNIDLKNNSIFNGFSAVIANITTTALVAPTITSTNISADNISAVETVAAAVVSLMTSVGRTIQFKAPAVLASDVKMTLPSNGGSVGQVLSTGGGENPTLDWVSTNTYDVFTYYFYNVPFVEQAPTIVLQSTRSGRGVVITWETVNIQLTAAGLLRFNITDTFVLPGSSKYFYIPSNIGMLFLDIQPNGVSTISSSNLTNLPSGSLQLLASGISYISVE
jgi:hypothetical protein